MTHDHSNAGYQITVFYIFEQEGNKMDLKNIIRFEPIDITHIVITIGLVLIIIYAFKSQLNSFFQTLQHRPITVKMSGSETTIELDAPVKTELLAQSISNPQGDRQQLQDWEQVFVDVHTIEGFQKLGFDDLYMKLSSLGAGKLAVINYAVDDPGKYYFKDDAMLKYLSIASEKIGYLSFYKDNVFVATIRTEDVISGLASNNERYLNFGNKLKNGDWQDFPGLIRRDAGFSKTPSVKELYDRLMKTGLAEVPQVENGKLIGFLNYKSISDELYQQVSETE